MFKYKRDMTRRGLGQSMKPTVWIGRSRKPMHSRQTQREFVCSPQIRGLTVTDTAICDIHCFRSSKGGAMPHALSLFVCYFLI